MRLPDPRRLIPRPQDFTSRLRGPEVTARVGLWLGITFFLAFVTGLYSHFAQDNPTWLTLPTRPEWLYRVTQGVHLIAGSAAVPLLLVKLWSVFPKLFERLDLLHVRRLGVQLAERASITLLVLAAIFQLVTGLANSSQWYPWAFSFRSAHYAVAWVAIGSLALHIAVKLPVIRDALTGSVDAGLRSDDTDAERATSPHPGESVPRTGPVTAGLSRRGLLRATWLATGVVVLSTAGASVPWLRRVSIFAVRSGDGPQGVPINTSAVAAKVVPAATSPSYTLEVTHKDRSATFTLADLRSMPQTTATLPIACVEGWSASGEWTGVRVSHLLDQLGAPAEADVTVESLQRDGPFTVTSLPRQFARDPLTLLALELNGETLSIDHGFPVGSSRRLVRAFCRPSGSAASR